MRKKEINPLTDSCDKWKRDSTLPDRFMQLKGKLCCTCVYDVQAKCVVDEKTEEKK